MTRESKSLSGFYAAQLHFKTQTRHICIFIAFLLPSRHFHLILLFKSLFLFLIIISISKIYTVSYPCLLQVLVLKLLFDSFLRLCLFLLFTLCCCLFFFFFFSLLRGSSRLMATALMPHISVSFFLLCMLCVLACFCACLHVSVFPSLPLAHSLFLLFIRGNLLSSGVCSSGYIMYIRERCRGRWEWGGWR